MFTPFINLRARRRERRRHRAPWRVQLHRHRTDRSRAVSCRPPASSIAIPSSTCSPGERKPSSRSPRSLVSPNETKIGAMPNEDSQSFMFDASNLFRANKFAGWDRVEGGGRLNVGVRYTAQFNQGGYLNVLVGQSYQLFGLNSFAVGRYTQRRPPIPAWTAAWTRRARTTSRKLTYAAEHPVHADVAVPLRRGRPRRCSDPNTKRRSISSVGDHHHVRQLRRRSPRSASWTPAKESSATARYKLSAELADLRRRLVTTCKNSQLNETQIGMGYVDDCLILALNYITEYRYSNPQDAAQSHRHDADWPADDRRDFATAQGISEFGNNSLTQGVLR